VHTALASRVRRGEGQTARAEGDRRSEGGGESRRALRSPVSGQEKNRSSPRSMAARLAPRCRSQHYPRPMGSARGVVMSSCQDKQALGLVTRRQRRWEAQQVVLLLARLAHHLLLWGKQWLSRVPATRRRLQGYGLVHLLRDV
jgi:hypothetical protein